MCGGYVEDRSGDLKVGGWLSRVAKRFCGWFVGDFVGGWRGVFTYIMSNFLIGGVGGRG